MPMNKRLGMGVVLVCATATPAAWAAQFFQTPKPLAPEAEWTNYLTLADLDGDGHLDVIVPNCGGFFVPPSPQALRVYANDGKGVFTDVSAQAVGGLVASVRVVALADVDGDGDLDVFAPSADGKPDRLFINGGMFKLTDEGPTRLGGLASRSAAARFGDFDNDGDADLLVAQGYAGPDTPPARLLLNDGMGVFSEAPAGSVPASTAGQDPDDIDLLDADRDFDIDVLLNNHEGPSALWINDGTGKFTEAPLPPLDQSHFHYGPSACDVDNDGDLDIWIDNVGGGFGEQLLINDGTGKFTDETAARVTGNPGADDNGVMCIDVDGDGDFDAAIPSLSNNERVLDNDGTGKFTLEAGAFPTVKDPTLWMDFGDLDGDGRLDAVTGQGEGSPQTNLVYLGAPAAPADTLGPRIIVVEQLPVKLGAGASYLLRFAVSDNAVTDLGPRLERAFARVAVDGGAPTEEVATFMGGDVFRAVLPSQSEQGAMVTVEPCARDRRGNQTCGRPQTYVIEGVATVSGAGGGGGGPGTGGADAAGPGAGGTGGASAGGDADDGCGCVVAGAPDRGARAWIAALVLVLVGARRRRRGRSW
jgi:MYXO-CTERM domain-containing protein